jgi:hypothetical protein
LIEKGRNEKRRRNAEITGARRMGIKPLKNIVLKFST